MATANRVPYFLQSIRHLREDENVLLYNNVLQITDEEAQDVYLYLRTEYENESLEYPYAVPAFDQAAALWAAKTVYLAAQLVLYRENKPKDLPLMFAPYAGEKTAGAILSADLCLRFLPAVWQQLSLMDPEDALLPILEEHLCAWHYSAVGSSFGAEGADMHAVTDNRCVYALYVNRIIARKDLKRARLQALEKGVRAVLGNYAGTFWKEFEKLSTH